ncbi:methyltransferase [Chromobacterium violaceum]|uniref:prepilin peptidase n=2 Tax=Chromobacterium violaceum TaxID=536 RepID=UPI000652DE17|nr:A24 family peptidase [Chromobacterium violaceum]ATP30090.1 prepilin peptidase [Chromobacterium violaceum]ATP33996.1 prepilin peptidase [Chromobacterium violaceum]KMN50312.1 methyltransferase [Chromobacterium violaceum]KMN87601.1 methyltransferase [Chromobacterium violaceum]KMN90688.1 methyltransferase [Chromobacterium violaceum]
MLDDMTWLLATHPAWLAGAALVFGLMVGSFLNVVIHRLPRMLEREFLADSVEYLAEGGAPAALRLAAEQARHELDDGGYNLWRPASHCPACRAPVRPWHNVPLLSYLLLRGRCGDCGEAISRRYPLVELLCGALYGFLAWKLGWGWPLAGALALTAVLLALAFIDFDTKLLPDGLTLPLLWGGLLFNLMTGLVPLSAAVLGAVYGYMTLWLVSHAYKLVAGRHGMGGGDFKLLAALGAWLGWTMLPLIILLSSLVGAVCGIAMMSASRVGRGQEIPFGPYLSAAGWIALVWGPQIMNGYLTWLSR